MLGFIKKIKAIHDRGAARLAEKSRKAGGLSDVVAGGPQKAVIDIDLMKNIVEKFFDMMERDPPSLLEIRDILELPAEKSLVEASMLAFYAATASPQVRESVHVMLLCLASYHKDIGDRKIHPAAMWQDDFRRNGVAMGDKDRSKLSDSADKIVANSRLWAFYLDLITKDRRRIHDIVVMSEVSPR